MYAFRPARRRRLRWWPGLALALALAWMPRLQAQEAEGPPPLPAADVQAIMNYGLNEDELQRLMAVVKEGHALGIRPARPSAASGPGSYTLDGIAAQAVSADARIAPLLARHGFTPRQFLLTNMAMSAAALAVQAQQHPELAAYVDTRHVNAANVAFYQAHLAEITAFLRARQDASDDQSAGAP